MQTANQKEFRIERIIKPKLNKLYVKWKGYDNSFNSWIAKKDSLNEWIFSRNKIVRKRKRWTRFVLNYATKTDFKISAGLDISSFAKKVHLDGLKPHLEQLDVA